MSQPSTLPEITPVFRSEYPERPNRPLVVTSFGLTDAGRVRPSNEDCFLIAELAKTLQVRQSNLAQPKTHWGDERGYLFLVADGMGGHQAGSPEQAANHPYRHVITNAVGGHERGLQAEVHKVELGPGDAMLLCTDGLTEMVPDDRMATILQAEPDPQHACERLVAEAKEQGGKDNVTVIVARFEASEGGERGGPWLPRTSSPRVGS
jgi:serine/threonine protein phosphatase PrpC